MHVLTCIFMNLLIFKCKHLDRHRSKWFVSNTSNSSAVNLGDIEVPAICG